MKVREIGIVIRNMILGANLESLGSLNHPRRVANYATECRFLYRSLFPNGGLPEKSVWEAFGAEQTTVTLYGKASEDWFRPVASLATDLISMCMLCQILKPKIIFEIGTYHGCLLYTSRCV